MATHGDPERALTPPFHTAPRTSQPLLSLPWANSPSASHPRSAFPAPGNLYGRGRCLTTLSGPAVVLEMQEIWALCKALSSGAREQEELLLQLLAAKDAAGAPSLDNPVLELTLEEANGCFSSPELEGDF
ncbi:hypothetical protein C0995_013706 [Termitomyces sp. Mi166|nr:hypothetical protein C0995_013706 [Termitomyces sp. Mi166\